MNRRDALKKLGIGGAIAVVTPAILDGFNVAHASSTQPPTTEDLQESTVVTVDGTTGAVRLEIDLDQFPPGTTLTWSLLDPKQPIDFIALPDGSVIVVDKTAGNSPTPSFTAVLDVVYPPSPGGTDTFYFHYDEVSGQVTVTE